MKLTKQEVEHIAKLARLELTENEKELYSKQLSSVLEYMEILNELDTDDVAMTSQVTGLTNVKREDEVEDCTRELREKLLNEAPDRQMDFIKVKGVFE